MRLTAVEVNAELQAMRATLEQAKQTRAAVLNKLDRVGMHLETVAQALKTKPESVRLSNIPFVLQGITVAGSADVFVDYSIVEGLRDSLASLDEANKVIAKLEQRLLHTS